jgi:hypothetical protein
MEKLNSQLYAELLYNPTEWDAKEESSTAKPGESGAAVRAEEETFQRNLQFYNKSCQIKHDLIFVDAWNLVTSPSFFCVLRVGYT